jgi:site-specific DNA recombinase
LPGKCLKQWRPSHTHGVVSRSSGPGRTKVEELQRQLMSLRNQQDRLLNLRLVDEIAESTFAARTRSCGTAPPRATSSRCYGSWQDEQAELALKVFELSQSLTDKWLAADCSVKRQILQMVCLNLKLEGATLIPTMKKPFDVLIEGLSQNYIRGDRI